LTCDCCMKETPCKCSDREAGHWCSNQGCGRCMIHCRCEKPMLHLGWRTAAVEWVKGLDVKRSVPRS
jgi:hypothetical protein